MADIRDNLTKIRDLVHEINRLDHERWLHFTLPTYRWWLLFAFLTVPWIIWVKVVKCGMLMETLLFGTLIGIIVILLNVTGYFFDFWDYPTEMIPLVPEAWAFDLSVVPVGFMLLYQFFPRWKTFGIALIGMAVVYAFIGEPLCSRLGLVIYYKWKSVYSFFVYLVFGIAVRALVEKIKSVQSAAGK